MFMSFLKVFHISFFFKLQPFFKSLSFNKYSFNILLYQSLFYYKLYILIILSDAHETEPHESPAEIEAGRTEEIR